MKRIFSAPCLLLSLAACAPPAPAPPRTPPPAPPQTTTEATPRATLQPTPPAAPPARAQPGHSHVGTGSSSACVSGRFDGAIKLYSLEEVGALNHPVSTKSADAQRYFNQGLTFFYGFDAESAMRSFHQAAVLDKDLAMAHWGVALAAGGDLNIAIDDPCMVLAVKERMQATALLDKASAPEQLYIKALESRYASSPWDVAQLSVDYALAMKAVHEKLGAQDPEAGALYAYSLMNLRPWLWWTTSGKPSTEIKEARRALDLGLKLFPDHLGLNHFKIHALEEAPISEATRARPSAEVLSQRAPVITPHLRHMPAHIFLLLGDWEDVVAANQRAVQADEPWVTGCKGGILAPTCNQLLVGHYYSHDMLFLDVGYNNQGSWEKVKPLSAQLEANVRTFLATQPGLEHFLTTNVMMMVHFAKWSDLDALSPPHEMPDPRSPGFCTGLDFKLASSIWYFGRAMAHASLGKPTDADVQGFEAARGCVQSAGLMWGNNTADQILGVVHWRMLERIARAKGRLDASNMLADLAVETEDLLAYDEPPGWYLSSRETHGASLYLAKDFGRAVDVFEEDLKRRPNNSRSLFGLWKALEALHSPKAEPAKTQFLKQWKSAVLPVMADM